MVPPSSTSSSNAFSRPGRRRRDGVGVGYHGERWPVLRLQRLRVPLPGAQVRALLRDDYLECLHHAKEVIPLNPYSRLKIC